MADAMLPKMLIGYSSCVSGDCALHHPRGLLCRRKPSVRRELIDEVWQILTEALEQLVVVQAGLSREGVKLLTPEGFSQGGRRNILIRSAIDPRLGHSSLTTVLQIVDQTTKAAAQHAAGGGAAE